MKSFFITIICIFIIIAAIDPQFGLTVERKITRELYDIHEIIIDSGKELSNSTSR